MMMIYRQATDNLRAVMTNYNASSELVSNQAKTDTDEALSDLLMLALHWKEAERKIALATVISTWGSSPRPVGSQLLVDYNGQMQGSVSGGCIEKSVIDEALQVIEDGLPRILEFGVSNEQAWEVGLACGGKIEIFIEPVD